MTTGLIHHPSSLLHDMGDGHPESPARIRGILDRLQDSGTWDALDVYTAHRAEDQQILGVHLPLYLQQLQQLSPTHGIVHAGADTAMGPHTLEAAYRAAGCGIQAADGVMNHLYQNAFCLTRPPGHHAEPGTTLGFCFFNNVAIAAKYLRRSYGVRRMAIIDFDVHQGNGTAEMFQIDPEILFISSFQHPFYPHTHWQSDHDNMLFTPLPRDSDGSEIRRAWKRDWQPALRRHEPEIILISAGFDAHRNDPMAELNWETEDYYWLSNVIADESHAGTARGKIISFLEGGYDVPSLADSVKVHTDTLLQSGH